MLFSEEFFASILFQWSSSGERRILNSLVHYGGSLSRDRKGRSGAAHACGNDVAARAAGILLGKPPELLLFLLPKFLPAGDERHLFCRVLVVSREPLLSVLRRLPVVRRIAASGYEGCLLAATSRFLAARLLRLLSWIDLGKGRNCGRGWRWKVAI